VWWIAWVALPKPYFTVQWGNQLVGGMAQWLGLRSLAGGLSLICARSFG